MQTQSKSNATKRPRDVQSDFIRHRQLPGESTVGLFPVFFLKSGFWWVLRGVFISFFYRLVGGIWWVYEFHHFSMVKLIIEIKERKHKGEAPEYLANGYWLEATFEIDLPMAVGLRCAVGIPSFVQPTSGRVLVLRPVVEKLIHADWVHFADCIHVVGTIHRPQCGHKIVVLLNLRHLLMPPLHFKKRAVVALPLCCIHTLGIFWQICNVASIFSASQGLFQVEVVDFATHVA